MTCPAGCLRAQGHPGFHTTHPSIANREDDVMVNAKLTDIFSAPNDVPIRVVYANALRPLPMQPNTSLRIYNVKPPLDVTNPKPSQNPGSSEPPSLFPKPQFIPPFKTTPRRPTYDNPQRDK